MQQSLVNLKAQAAMRAEDLRIATKHREEAAARPMSPSNAAAYQRAVEWEDLCRERAQNANGRVITATLADATKARLVEGGRV